ncbi:MAG: zinc metallopeptidase [bacterium]|nr:zinc metallopeptidase [bacterium]
MKWQGRRVSSNVEDRRRFGGKGIAMGGGLGGIVIVVLYLMLGGNPDQLMQTLQPGGTEMSTGAEQPLSAQQEQEGQFVGVILAETEDVWGQIFAANGESYRQPRLVLFSNQISSACGHAGASAGPFYCPTDERVYIDLEFFAQMQAQLGARGDFALAYVIAHEVGHHIQNQMGTMQQVQSQRDQLSEAEYNRLSVRLELQADFLAGVWAHYAARTAGLLEEGDIEEGINAASAVGDDRIMKQTQGYVVPDGFTHGTSEQRVRWFLKGYQSGDVSQGDTFSAASL